MKHYLYALGAIFCWASLPAATGSGLKELDIIELMFYSFGSAAIYLYFQDVILFRRPWVYIPPPKVLLLGLVGIFGYHFVYYLALSFAPLAEGAILATTWSFWIVVISSIVLFKRLKMAIVLTAAVGMFGTALVIGAGKDVSFSLGYMRGYLLALMCGLIWSSFSVALGRLKLSGEPMTVFTLLTAAVSTILFVTTMPHEVPSTTAIFSAIYLGCIPLGLSFFLWNRAVTGGNMVIIGFLSYLTPPLAVILVAIIHSQQISSQVLLGMFIIIAASIGGRLALAKEEKER